MTNALITRADTALSDDHRQALASAADPETAAEGEPISTLGHRPERLRLGSAEERLRWLRTYALLWLAGLIFYLLLAAGAFLADGFLTWNP